MLSPPQSVVFAGFNCFHCQGQLIKEIRENLYNVSASTATKCDIIDYDSITKDEFIRDYVSRSRPVILRGAAKTWPALTLWTNDYLTY